MIELREVGVSYGEKEVLENLTLQVKEGEFLVIIGASGCGKTTLLKMINGLITPTKGEVFVGGNDLKVTDLIEMRRNIGYVVQGAKLFPHMTVENNIMYVPSLSKTYTKEEKDVIVDELLRLVDLNVDIRGRFPSQLSGGQQQRVGIARALASKPRILLMDEPFGAVDGITRKGLQKQLATLHQETNITVIFITHDIGEAMTLGTRVVAMDQGKIIEDATPKEMKENPKTDFVKELLA